MFFFKGIGVSTYDIRVDAWCLFVRLDLKVVWGSWGGLVDGESLIGFGLAILKFER